MNPSKSLSASRRDLMKWGALGLGGLMLSALPKAVSAQSGNSTLTFNADDAGSLNFALLLEELEAAFYAAAAASGQISDATELEYVNVLGAQEAAHVVFLRSVLGDQVSFETENLSFNSSGLNALLSDRS
ncbi:MAG: ferritin-like domain-containing protein, partial [Phormidesmis sp.]